MGRLVLVLGVLAAAGCFSSPARVRAFDGPPRPDGEVARVQVRSRVRGLDLEVIEVDGRPTSVHEWQELMLLPGRHELLLEGESGLDERVFFGPDGAPRPQPAGATFELVAEAGRGYLVTVEDDGTGPRARLYDVGAVDGPPAADAAAAAPEGEEPVQRVVRTPAAPPRPEEQDAGPPPDDAPYVLVLGTAQDGGLPQVGCEEEACAAARADPRRRRRVTSLLIADPRTRSRWLVEATPDLRAQVALAAGHPAGRDERLADVAGRPPLFEGVFLTHAHVGHYTGLMHLGREVHGARDVPVHASERMAAFLAENEPWRALVERGNVRLERLTPGRPVELAPDLAVEPFLVPHRDELSDTLGFVVRGPRRALLFVPDVDRWERWDERVEDRLAAVDAALLDGTFYAAWELPGRDLAEIPHPFVVETIARLQALPADERAKVAFVHLNHTNPIADPASPEAAAVRAAGMRVASEGERIDL